MCTGGGVGGATASSERRALEDDIRRASVSEIVRDSAKTRKKSRYQLRCPLERYTRAVCLRGSALGELCTTRERVKFPPHVRKRSGMPLY